MNLKLENLEKIDDILNKLNALEEKISAPKRWLNTREAAIYLGYSKDHMYKLKDNHFIQGIHFYKKAGRVLFDKVELDNCVRESVNKIDVENIIKNTLKDLI